LDITEFRALQTSEERFNVLSSQNFNDRDTVSKKLLFKQLHAVIVEKNDLHCLFYWHFLIKVHFTALAISREEAYEGLKEMWQKGDQQGYPIEAIVGHFWYHLWQSDESKISPAQFYTMILHDYDQMERLGFERFKAYNVPDILFNMSQFMYRMGDNEKAFQYLKVAERFVQPTLADEYLYTLVMDYLEDYHAKKGEYQEAMAYNQKIYDLHHSLPSTKRSQIWQGLALLNIASIYVKMGKTQEAESYSTQGYELCKTKPDELVWESQWVWAEFEGVQVLIDIKLKLGKIKEAEPLLQRCELLSKYMHFKDNYYFKSLKWYQNYVAFYDASHNIPQAYQYMKLAKNMEDSLNRRNDARQLEQIKLRRDTEKYNAQLDLKNAEIAFSNRLRWFFIGGLSLLSFLSFALWQQYQKKNKANFALNASNKKLATLMKELHHRVKNNLQIVSSLLNLQSYRITDDNAAQAIKDSKMRVDAMSLIHQSLYQTDDVSTLDIKTYITNLCESLMSAYGYSPDNFDLTINVPQTQLSVDSAIPIGLILNELVTNSFKYAYKNVKDPALTIGFNLDNEPTLDVIDNGTQFRKADWERPSMSFGKQLINSLTQQISGQLSLNTEGGQTHFQIVLPQLVPSF
jgi:two-component sensor histidine kinase